MLVCLTLFIASCGTVPKTTVLTVPEGPPIAEVNDSLYAQVLERAISPSGTIEYPELISDTDLSEYLHEIAKVQLDAFVSRAQQLAFWINVHNAYVLDLIRSNWNNGATRSIDDIPGFRYANVIWVGGERYSLHGIEHEIIERQFREPRAFFALFDGSRSSPPLLRVPYTDQSLSDQLDAQLKGFLADSTKNYLDRRSNTLYLSRIFETYSNDLSEAAGGTVADFVRLFAPPKMAQWIARHHDVTISYLRYDYTINSTYAVPRNAPLYRPIPPRRATGGIR